MPYIALCGLHGAGKSFLAQKINSLQKWKVIEKRAALKQLHRQHFSDFGTYDPDWDSWYKSIYKKTDSATILNRILSSFALNDTDQFIIIDSVHTIDEWSVLQERDPRSKLLLVCAPEAVRHSRMDEPPEMDDRRAHYWHRDTSCLMRYVDWAITSTVSEDLFLRQCDAFIQYATNTT